MKLEEAIRARYSVRKYMKKQVPHDAIVKLVDAARWAPYASERWRFVAVQEEETRSELAEAARQKWILSAPVIMVVGADFTIPRRCEWRWDADHWWTLFPIQDTAAAIQNLMLTAVDLGLGTCWIGSFNDGDVARIVGFPFAIRPVALITLGYPAEEPGRRERRPVEEVLFWEAYEGN